MDLLEQLVMEHLARHPHVFLNLQYSIKKQDEDKGQWSCPDFVKLDFHAKTVAVVEVTGAFKIDRLAAKVKDQEKQWISMLRAQLVRNGVVDNSWRYEVEVFIRSDVVSRFRELIGPETKVKIHVLEDLGLPWQWDYSSEAG
jgi:hypothetical protein